MNVDNDINYLGTNLFLKLNYGTIFVGLQMHKKDYKTIKKNDLCRSISFDNLIQK